MQLLCVCISEGGTKGRGSENGCFLDYVSGWPAMRGSMSKSVVVVCQCRSSKIVAEGDLCVRVVVSAC